MEPSPPDPIVVLILVAQNGYGREIALCGALSRDPDLWACLARARHTHGRTWLHAAVHLRHDDRVSFLCDVGAPLEAKIDVLGRWGGSGLWGGKTPLHLCFSEAYIPILRLLVARGADVNADCGTPYSSLIWKAVLSDDDSLLECLLQLGASTASRHGQQSLFGYSLSSPTAHNAPLFLRYGADANAPLNTTHDRAPLHYACGSPHIYGPERVALLLDHGANVNARDAMGRTPMALLLAILPPQPRLLETARILQDRGGTI